MKANFIVRLMAVFVILNTACCKRKDCEEQKSIIMDPFYLGVVANYMYFKPGSFWIYKNSISGELDTVVQISCDTQYFEKQTTIDNIKYIYSYTMLDYSQIYKRNECLVMSTSSHIVNPREYRFFRTFQKSCAKPSGGGSNCNFMYPFDTAVKGFVGSFTYYRNHFDSLDIEGKKYYNIRVFEVELDQTINYPTTAIPIHKGGKGIYYWAQYVGLIKVENVTYNYMTMAPITHSWDLTNFQIK